MNFIVDFQHLGLSDVYNKGKTVPGEKLFTPYELVFEPRGLRDFQNTYIRTNQIGILVKDEANEVFDFEVYFELYDQ